MKKYEMRLFALRDLISRVDSADRRGNDWYIYSDSFFDVLHTYKALEIISCTEHDFIFESMNHCYYSDCFEIRPFLENLYHDEIMKQVKKSNKD